MAGDVGHARHAADVTRPVPTAPRRGQGKDAVENELHKEVCAGMLTLQEAQQIIVTVWFKYYRDHVLK